MTKLMIILTVAILGQAARADYHCNGEAGQLTIFEKHPTHFGDASAALESNGMIKHFYGKLTTMGMDFYFKKVIALYPYQGSTLTIASQPGHCTRVSCGGNEISANLTLGPNPSYFSCNEQQH